MTIPPEEPQSNRQSPSGEYRPSYGAGAQQPSRDQGQRADHSRVEEQSPPSSAEETPHGGRPQRKRLFVVAALVAVLALIGGVGGLIYYSEQAKGGVAAGDLAAASSSAAAASSSIAAAVRDQRARAEAERVMREYDTENSKCWKLEAPAAGNCAAELSKRYPYTCTKSAGDRSVETCARELLRKGLVPGA